MTFIIDCHKIWTFRLLADYVLVTEHMVCHKVKSALLAFQIIGNIVLNICCLCKMSQWILYNFCLNPAHNIMLLTSISITTRKIMSASLYFYRFRQIKYNVNQVLHSRIKELAMSENENGVKLSTFCRNYCACRFWLDFFAWKLLLETNQRPGANVNKILCGLIRKEKLRTTLIITKIL